MAHKDDDDCTNPDCPVHGGAASVVDRVRSIIDTLQNPVVRTALAIARRNAEPIQHGVPLVTNAPAMTATIFITCTGCQERNKYDIPGHHIRTIHRILGEILEKYPEECVEVLPTAGNEPMIARQSLTDDDDDERTH